MLKLLRSRRGEGYIDTAVMILCVMLVIAVAMSVLPVFVTKNRLDTYASTTCVRLWLFVNMPILSVKDKLLPQVRQSIF